MAAPTLHDVHDPLCGGWCYAVTPMIEAVAQAGIRVVPDAFLQAVNALAAAPIDA